MKHRTMKRLLAAALSAAMLATALPANLTPVQAANKTVDAASTLDELGVIDAKGEEDTASDLSDRKKENAAAPYAASGGDMVIAIDAGHGGSDSGASYGGMKEKDVNLKIAKYIKAYLQDYEGVQVYLTRSDDTAVGLSERVSNSVEAGADVFISVHNNASSNTDTSGSMVFYPNASYRPQLNSEGSGLAASILENLTALGLPDLGIRTRDSETGNTYEDGSLADYYSVIRNAKYSGITGIIVEHAFVSSAYDRENYLGTDAQLRKLAMADVKGITDYYDLKYNGLTKPSITLSAPKYKTLQVKWNEQDTADGYLLYRAQSKNGKYSLVAKVLGSENTVYVDENISLGKNYYYKVKAYNRTGGVTLYSDLSRIVRGNAIGGTQINAVNQMSKGYLRLSWKQYADADGYAIYRSTDGGAYERIATISDTDQTTYSDRSAAPGTTCKYRVRTIHTLYNNEGFGKWSDIVTVNFLADPVMKRIDLKESGKLKVYWTKTPGASSYVLQRSTSENGTYKTIATITDDMRNSYLDAGVERGMTYYYRVVAYNQHGIVKGSTGYVAPMGVKNIKDPQITAARVSETTPGMEIKWTKTPGAEGYRIYRSTKKTGGYTKIAVVKGADTLHYFDEGKTEIGETYYYKVNAYLHNSAGLVSSSVSSPVGVTAGYGIMGASSTTASKMAAWFKARGGVYPEEIYSQYGAPTLKDFCKIVYNEAKAEGVKAEVVFAQICKETGFLRFGGDVEPEQCNFAGIGATGGGAKGATFPDVTTGIRAQVQHLKAYASDEPLNRECVDPRFSYVKRCAAIYVEWLGVHENPTGAGWATGVNYGYSLRDDYIKSLLSY